MTGKGLRRGEGGVLRSGEYEARNSRALEEDLAEWRPTKTIYEKKGFNARGTNTFLFVYYLLSWDNRYPRVGGA